MIATDSEALSAKSVCISQKKWDPGHMYEFLWYSVPIACYNKEAIQGLPGSILKQGNRELNNKEQMNAAQSLVQWAR